MSSTIIPEPLPFQRIGVDTMKSRKRNLLADEMGLGKTLQSVFYIKEQTPALKKILIVAPSFLKGVWLDELERCRLTEEYFTQVIDSGRNRPIGDILIVSYELTFNPALYAELIDQKYDLLICDEAHYLKSITAKRTQHVLGTKHIPGLVEKSARFLAVTGTPFLNTAGDIYTLLKRLRPEAMKNFTHASFGRYFAYIQDSQFSPTGYSVTGFRNHKELNQLLAPVMVRRLKKDVLPELPDKQYQIVHVERTGRIEKLIREEAGYSVQDARSYFEYQTDFDDPFPPENDYSHYRHPFAKIAKLRHDMGLAKIPFILDVVKNDLMQIDKIFIVAFHKAILYTLAEELNPYGVVIITGDQPAGNRHELAKEFQTNPEKKVCLGQMKAVGVGLTLTAASLCIFTEPWWVPGDIDQVADRLHRIGQKDSVLIKFLLVPDSLDTRIMDSAVTKQLGIDMVYRG